MPGGVFVIYADFVGHSRLCSPASSLALPVLLPHAPLGLIYVGFFISALVVLSIGKSWSFVLHVSLLPVVLYVVFCRFSSALSLDSYPSVR